MGLLPSLVLSFILIVWFILSILKYFSFAKDRITYFDGLLLIPTWNFFAPEPNKTDYYLYYRVFSDHSESPWRLAGFGDNRKWFGFMWNPYRRDRKAFFDLSQMLVTNQTLHTNDVLLSMPYLLMLNYVSSLCLQDLGNKVQFAIGMIVPSQTDSSLSMAFISQSHELKSD